jgi:hypothetical protein
MNSTNLAHGAWTERNIQNNAAIILVCHVYDRWNISQRRNRANLARGPWTEHTIQNNAATIEVFHVYDRWNISQRMNRANLARGPWTERNIQNNAARIEVFHIALFCMVYSIHGPRARLALFILCKIFQRS